MGVDVLNARCVGEDNVDTVAVALESGLKLMDDFVWPKEEVEKDNAELSVIDMEKLRKASEADLDELLKDLLRACQEWGFFRIVNHGVNAELFQKLEEQTLRLFLLPVEAKRNAPCPLNHEIGFYSGADSHIFKHLIWHEGLQLFCDPVCVDEHAQKFWPNGDGEEFSSTIKEYMKVSQDLGLEILRYLASAVKIDPSKLTKHCTGTNSGLRLNYYPICDRPADTLGLSAHADDDALTILYEDQVGGLQVQRDNKWFAVKPQPNTLVVNVGDILQVWSNDLYTSVVHRVVVNNQKRRVSAALFLYPEPESLIEPAAEVIDEDHPCKYKQFPFEEYRVSFYEGDLISKPKSRFKLIQLPN
uniref:Fe(II)/2-oxoglutarate-dependent dioxygenase 1 n=1 Tax=Phlegmariurus tetrastichus TaxID=1263146 RepID=A0A8F1NN95_9TRAC|nr:Fe(II)/2-oxoglutarate-dependent dioxygenase 1 [Phlegmariurus tetrastichus]